MLRIIHKVLLERHIFQFDLILEKLQGVILYANLDTILILWTLKPFIQSYIIQFTCKEYYIFQKLFSVLFEWNVFQCRLIPEKSSCIISFLNLDVIDVLFEYPNPLFFKIKSHVL